MMKRINKLKNFMILKQKEIFLIESYIKRNSPLYNHRVFNNWIKSVQIAETLEIFKIENPDIEISVMDLGCGKGGDLLKFSHGRIRNYIGVDIAIGQLRDALVRKVSSNFGFSSLFVKAKGQDDPLIFYKNFPDEIFFDVISAQFCMHYFFENEQSVRNFLENISKRLVKGGYFISTFPDWKVLLQKVSKGYEKGNNLVYWDNKYASVIFSKKDLEKTKPFGVQYGFFLDDELVGRKKENDEAIQIKYIPEYLVILDEFLKLASEYGLELDETMNFHDYFADKIQHRDNHKLMKIMKFNTKQGDRLMEEDTWECSYLYRTLRLRKVTGLPPNLVKRDFKNRTYFKLIKQKFQIEFIFLFNLKIEQNLPQKF